MHLLPDVEFDHAAAAEAAAQCREVATRLDVTALSRELLAHPARSAWAGPHRDHFDERFGALQSATADLATTLRRQAASIDAASVAASEEQARRERVNAARIEEARRQRAAACSPAKPSSGHVVVPNGVR